jgi:formate dehydrogenase maturation protein FdhE
MLRPLGRCGTRVVAPTRFARFGASVSTAAAERGVDCRFERDFDGSCDGLGADAGFRDPGGTGAFTDVSGDSSGVFCVRLFRGVISRLSLAVRGRPGTVFGPQQGTISAMITRPRSTARPDPRDVAELRALAERQPELSGAVALQIALVDAVRRVQGRVATASVALSPVQIASRLASGQPLLDFDRLPIEWTDARLLFRQVTDILRRNEAIDVKSGLTLHEVGRSGSLPDLARRWFENGQSDSGVEMLDEVLAWALRPFLCRAAEVLQQRAAFGSGGDATGQSPAFGAWKRGVCPVCGGEPDFACITTTGERLLICGRCQTRWPTEPFACPFCGEAEKERITSFATPDGTYRVTACQSCRRYLKTIDGRRAGRGAMPNVDAIATLPLDAVVMQRGFNNG